MSFILKFDIKMVRGKGNPSNLNLLIYFSIKLIKISTKMFIKTICILNYKGETFSKINIENA